MVPAVTRSGTPPGMTWPAQRFHMTVTVAVLSLHTSPLAQPGTATPVA